MENERMFGTITKTETIQKKEDKEILKEIEILKSRLKTLNNKIGLSWISSNVYNLVDIDIDEDILKQARKENDDDYYIGKGYQKIAIGNKLHFVPIYFTKAQAENGNIWKQKQ